MNDFQSLISRLKKHNQWRRGEIELSTAELDPKQIGQDIDDCISYLELCSKELECKLDIRERFDELFNAIERWKRDKEKKQNEFYREKNGCQN